MIQFILFLINYSTSSIACAYVTLPNLNIVLISFLITEIVEKIGSDIKMSAYTTYVTFSKYLLFCTSSSFFLIYKMEIRVSTL